MSRHDFEPVPENDWRVAAIATSIAQQLIEHIRAIESASDSFERQWATDRAIALARHVSKDYPRALKLHEIEKETTNDTTNQDR